MVKIRNFLLYSFIILAPSLNSLQFLTIGGVNLTTVILLLLTIIGLVPIIGEFTKNRYFASVLSVVFLVELYITSIGGSQLGLILSMTLFIEFLVLDDKTVNIQTVNKSYFVSVVIAAFFSITQGFVGGGVKRTATMVDGSIAVITIALILFSPQYTKKEKNDSNVNVVAAVSALIVLLFGMSRSRIILVIGLFIAKLFWGNNKKSKRNTIALFAVVLLAVLFLFESSLGEMLFRSITGRFESGLESEGRDDEILFGLSLFATNPIWGVGWEELTFIDYLNETSGYSHHNMYIAVLARGGIVLAIPVLISIILLLKDSIKTFKTNKLPLILMAVFLLLAYGNAGFLNYTICSFFIPIVINLQKAKHDRFNVYNQ